MLELYVQAHWSQYAAGLVDITRHEGCVWTAVANGIAATTGGRARPTPDQVHGLVSRTEETSPETPGWSLDDAARAAGRFGVPLQNRSGQGWSALRKAHDDRLYIVLQGDSDQFSNATCSGSFDGPHAIGIHPKTKVDALGVTWWWIDDPICKSGRWEREDVLRRYAAKLSAVIRFAVFMQPVPPLAIPAPKSPAPTLHYGGRALARPVAKRVRVPRANGRVRPAAGARIALTRTRGQTFTAWQVTDHGYPVNGSTRWFGNRYGNRWMPASRF